MYHYRCLNHLPTPLYHCIISKVCLQIFGNICFVYICVTNPSSTNTSGYICIYFFQRKKSTLKCVEPRRTKGTKTRSLIAAFGDVFIENPPKLADGDSYGVQPRKLERSFEIKTFRKEGEEIHPSGNEHIPPIGNF